MSKKNSESEVIDLDPIRRMESAGVIDLDANPVDAQEKLSNAIHHNLSNAAERVVHAAVEYVLNEDRDDFALEDAVSSFLDADDIHDALVELHPASASAKIKKTKTN
jgi:hypothetical protein